jgi:hypothetical protein
MKQKLLLPFLLFSQFLFAQRKHSISTPATLLPMIDSSLMLACGQYRLMMQHLPQDQLPIAYESKNKKIVTRKPSYWTSGFYPGILLYLYEFSKDSMLLNEGIRSMNLLENEQYNTKTHDLGFMMYCSYGNAYRLFGNKTYENVLIQSAKSLASRFNPKIGLIKSWERTTSLDGKTPWKFPVIIDNMINLELLFFASKATGDPSYRDIAIKHALATMKNHFRPDHSTYHVVDYDPETGAVRHRQSYQGFADNSTWSRGQAWAVYGYTMVYRETGKKKFLKTACRAADFFLNNKDLPEDKVPYWDFNANQAGYTPHWKRKYNPDEYAYIPRDASAGAVVASALLELAGYVNSHKSKRYFAAAEAMLHSLCSNNYTASIDEDSGFVLKHCTGSFPHGAEIDEPIIYGDYYFIEALMRYVKMNNNNQLN